MKESVRDELERKTRDWMEVRRQHGAEQSLIDKYANMILEIITRGKTSHAREFLKT